MNFVALIGIVCILVITVLVGITFIETQNQIAQLSD